MENLNVKIVVIKFSVNVLKAAISFNLVILYLIMGCGMKMYFDEVCATDKFCSGVSLVCVCVCD